MKISHIKLLTVLLFILLSLVCSTTSSSISESFLQCFACQIHSNSTSNIVLTKNSSSYSSVLQSSIQNPRFLNTSTPEAIITPSQNSHVQAAVVCSKKVGIQIRTRSGGHDYEGLSYLSKAPFIIIDLFKLRAIDVNIEKKSAWVESGATLGELYYAIAQKSNLYGFAGGTCPTIGMGGHISGGGHGTLFRTYGLAADNVIDAKIVDVNGRVLNRKSMGEELFWAIRGGGGSSFGVILSWKLRLSPVPASITGYTQSKTIEEGAAKLVSKWQAIADQIPEEYFVRLIIQVTNGTNGGKTIQVAFNCVFLDTVERVLPWMQQHFPELNLDKANFIGMSWIESALYIANMPRDQPELLLQRTQQSPRDFKGKSDFVTAPISEAGLNGMWQIMLEVDSPILILTPYGGRMSAISDSETPFPHRKGNLFEIQYFLTWGDGKDTEKNINWMRKLYDQYMTPYVSKSPRGAYLNYRDLDLGTNSDGNTTYAQASIWGMKYFKNNFRRLAQVKTSVDPGNFFRNEQSIPVLPFFIISTQIG